MSMRIRGLDEDGSKLAGLLPELEDSFKRIGVQLREDDLTFRSTYDVIKDLANVWDELSDMERANILEQVAGKRQGNIVAAMIKNIRDMESATESARNSQGSAAREQQKYMESLEFKVAQTKNAWIGFWQATIDTKAIHTLLSGITLIANSLTFLVDTFGVVTPLVVSSTVAMYALNESFRNGYNSVVKFITGAQGATSLKGVFNSIYQSLGAINWESIKANIMSLFSVETWKAIKTRVVTTLTTLATSVRSFSLSGIFAGITWSGVWSTFVAGARVATAAVATLIATIAPLVIVTGLTIAVQKLYEAWQKHKNAAADRVKVLEEEQETYRQNIKNIESLTAEYEKLEAIKKRSIEQDQRLLEIQTDLTGMMPEILDYYDAEGKAHYKTAQEVKALVEEYKKRNAELNFIRADQAAEAGEGKFFDLRGQTGQLEKAKADVEKYTKLVADAQQKLQAYANQPVGNGLYDKETRENALNQLTANLREYQSNLSEAKAKIQKTETEMVANQEWWANSLIARSESVAYQTGVENKQFGLEMNRLAQSVVKSTRITKMSAEDFEQWWAGFTTSITKAVANGELKFEVGMGEEDQKKLIAFMSLFGFSAEEVGAVLQNLTPQVEEAKEQIWNFATRMDELIEKSDSLSKNIESLAKAYDGLEEGQQLNTTQLLSLIKTYPQIAAKMQLHNGILTVTKEIVEEVARAEEARTKAEIQAAKEREIARLNELKVKKAAAISELAILRGLTLAQQQAAQSAKDTYELASANLSGNEDEETKLNMLGNVGAKFGPLFSQIAEAEALIKAQDVAISTDFFKTATNAIDSKEKDKKDTEPFVEDEFADRLAENERAMSQIGDEMERVSQTSERYSELVNMEIKLLKERQKIYHENANALRAERAELLAKAAATDNLEKKNKFLQEADQAEAKIQSLGQNWFSTQSEINKRTLIDPKQFDTVTQITEKLTEGLNALDDKMAESENRIKSHTEGSKAWRDEMLITNSVIMDKISLIGQAKKALEEEISIIQGRLDSETEMSASVRQILTDRLKEIREQVRGLNGDITSLTGSLVDNNKAMADADKEFKTTQKELADAIVDAYRSILDERKRIQEEALEAEEDAEKRRHEDTMERLDDELSQYEKIIEQRLALIDAEQDKKDFDRDIEKATKERDETQKQIDILALDNSMEGQAKLAELRKKLSEQDEKIEEAKEKRKTQLRKDALKKELDTYKAGVEEKKEAEDDFNKAEERRFEAEKKRIEAEYQAEVNNIDSISKIRQKVMEGDFKWLQEQLGSYFDTFDTLATEKMGNITKQIKSAIDLADELKDLQSELAEFESNYGGNYTPPASNSGSGNTGNNTQPSGATNPNVVQANEKTEDFRKYIQNKIEWQKIFEQQGTITSTRQDELKNKNTDLRKKWGFIDYTYEEILRHGLDKFDTGGYTGKFGPGGKIAMLHEKEIVLDQKDTKNLLATVDVVRRIVPFLRDLRKIVMPQPATQVAVPNGPTIPIHIDKFVGTEENLESLSTKIVNKLKRMGQ